MIDSAKRAGSNRKAGTRRDKVHHDQAGHVHSPGDTQ